MTRCTLFNLPSREADHHGLINWAPARHGGLRPQPTAMIDTADTPSSLAIQPNCGLSGPPGGDKLAAGAMVAKQRSLAGSAARL